MVLGLRLLRLLETQPIPQGITPAFPAREELLMDNTAATEGFTDKVLQAYANIEDPRLKFIVAVLIKHLHACVREMKPTDEEGELAWDYMERMAAITGPERNEFLLLGDVIGVSQLIETLNHEKPGQPVGYALVGPFLRANSPFRARGAATFSEDTAGLRVKISGRVYDYQTKTPIKEAILDTWQAATNGFYENQDENQPDYNLRGRFKSDENGTYEVLALMPTAYPAPTDGPVGELLRAAKRSPYRPAHIHFIVSAPGYETLVTQIFVKGDQRIADDVVFTASENMVGNFRTEGDHYLLTYDFPLKPGVSKMPKAPIPA
jgi:catechol 1,2-dioxygenase